MQAHFQARFQDLLGDSYAKYGVPKLGEPLWVDFTLEKDEQFFPVQFALVRDDEGVQVLLRPQADCENQEQAREILEKEDVSNLIEQFIAKSFQPEAA